MKKVVHGQMEAKTKFNFKNRVFFGRFRAKIEFFCKRIKKVIYYTQGHILRV